MMKLPIRVLLVLLCAAVIVAMPFAVSSPMMLEGEKMNLMNGGDDGSEWDEGEEEIDFGRLFFPSACAEGEDDLTVETWVEGELHILPEWKLPLDFTVPPAPNPAGFTEDGYADDSIRVRVETREMNGITVHAAFVQVADASQFRTATPYGIKSSRTLPLASIAPVNHAVIAMNGDLFTQLPDKKSFEYRMGEKIRSKSNKQKDILIIDDLGDFHFFLRSKGLSEYSKQMKNEGRQVVNAFTFGPALVVDGEVQSLEKEYDYARLYKNPRSAIGQTGPLSYVMAVIEGRGDEGGATHAELAAIMKELGCVQAYNLDGGNTAEMIMFGADGSELFHFKGDQIAEVRGQSDIIFFATAVPETEW